MAPNAIGAVMNESSPEAPQPNWCFLFSPRISFNINISPAAQGAHAPCIQKCKPGFFGILKELLQLMPANFCANVGVSRRGGSQEGGFDVLVEGLGATPSSQSCMSMWALLHE